MTRTIRDSVTLTGAALWLCWALALEAGSASNIASADSTSGKAAPQETPIPRSVFEIPKNAKDGRDPFFPNSARREATPAGVPKSTPSAPAITLTLKALSGSAANRLATINNVTFAAGEEAEVLSGATRIRVKVLEIKDDSVEIETGGARRVLRMRPGF